MFPPSIFLVVLVTILPICAGFQSVKMFDRLLMKRNVVEKDNYAKISTFQELMKAIIEAIPTVLKPAKEMDRSKVINNPPKFLKAASTSGLRKSHKGKSEWQKQEEIDNFLSEYFPSEDDRQLLKESLERSRKQGP